jgi:hypothetical protein
MKNHSKAPWSIASRSNSMSYVVSSDNKLVARAIACDGQRVSFNELLIVAAPELLDAVERALDEIESDVNGYLSNPVHKALKDAYRKATGTHHGS